MKREHGILAASLMSAGTEQDQVVDVFEVIAAFDRAAEMEIWPGFKATAYPTAGFDCDLTLLLRHPSPPPEFVPLEGHEGVWVSPGKLSAMRWNSNADIGGVPAATLPLTIEPGRPAEYEAHILFHEVLDRRETLQAHFLSASHPRGELSLNNPLFARRSLDGMIALTVSAGDHPFLHGFRQVSIAGFSGDPTVVRDADTITVTAEGFSASFDGALLESTEEELVVTVLAATLDE